MFPFDVLYEDNHLLLLNKYSGVPSQPDASKDPALTDHVGRYLKEKYNKPGNVFVGLVHRLDRPVSGLIAIARTSKALERMNAIFAQREVKKSYFAVVKNAPPQESGKLIHWLSRNQDKNMSKAHKEEKTNTQRAELDYELIAKSDRYFLLKIILHTGRHHQIRAQLSAIGCPIKGDLKYGADRSNPDGSISLHSRELQFEHPVKKELLHILAPMPDSDVWKEFKKQLGERSDSR